MKAAKRVCSLVDAKVGNSAAYSAPGLAEMLVGKRVDQKVIEKVVLTAGYSAVWRVEKSVACLAA